LEETTTHTIGQKVLDMSATQDESVNIINAEPWGNTFLHSFPGPKSTKKKEKNSKKARNINYTRKNA